MFEEEERLPELFSVTNFATAILVHAAMLLAFWMSAKISFKEEEAIIPIDLTVVVQENLDGNENEPPPLTPPEPEPPKPEPPKPKPEPPKPVEPPKVADAVVKEPVQTNVVKKVEKKPDPPKPTAKELREQRMKEMLESAVVVNTPAPKTPPKTKPQPPRTNGKTGFKKQSDEEIARLLNQGYKPGVVDSIATSDDQRCISMIKKTFYEKWTPPAYSPTLKKMELRVQFNSDSTVAGYRLVKSSGDVAADNSVLAAAAAVKYVPGLTAGFLGRNKTVSIDFTVTGR